MRFIRFLVAVVFIWCGDGVHADLFPKDQRGPFILESGISIRARSLAGAYVALADEASGQSWNPAGMQRVPRAELAGSFAQGASGFSEQSLSLVFPRWWGEDRHTVGGSFVYTTEDSFTLLEEGVNQGTSRPNELSLGLAYAFPWRTFHFGLRAQGISQEIIGDTHQGWAVDLGMQNAFVSNWRWGAALANLGPRLSADGPRPPTLLRLGLARSWGHRFLVPVEAEWSTRSVPDVGIGGEWKILSRAWEFSLRTGYQIHHNLHGMDRLTFGAGMSQGDLRLDYAYLPSDALNAEQRLELGWRFGAPLTKEVRKRTLIEDAHRAVERGKWVDSQSLLTEGLKQFPNSWELQQLSVEVEKRLQESLDPDTLYHIGLERYSKGELEEAEVFLKKRSLVRPSNPEAEALLAKVERLVRSLRQQRLTEKMARDAKKEAVRLRGLTERSIRAGDIEIAFQASVQWAEIDPLGGSPVRNKIHQDLLERARVAALQNRPEALRLERLAAGAHPDAAAVARIATLEKAIQDENAAMGRRLYEEGLQAYREGRREKARQLFFESARFMPKDPALIKARERLDREMEILIK